MTETINGLHSCKPSNAPIVGQVKVFTVEHRTSKTGKPWLKIKSAALDQNGQPYRILSAEKTDFVDAHGNISFNVEIEPVNGDLSGAPAILTENDKITGQTPKVDAAHTDGVDETRRHLMQSVNLYNLCVDAVDKCIKPHIENMDAELYQAAIGTLFIEASHKRTNDGVNWYSYVDKLPSKPIK